MMISGSTFGAFADSSDLRLWLKIVFPMVRKIDAPMNCVNIRSDMATETSVGFSTVWIETTG